MTMRDLLRLLAGFACRRGVPFRYDSRHGKGSHGRIYFGEHATTVPGIEKELRLGLLHSILRDLGLKRTDLE